MIVIVLIKIRNRDILIIINIFSELRIFMPLVVSSFLIKHWFSYDIFFNDSFYDFLYFFLILYQ